MAASSLPACRICFEEEATDGALLSPCGCRGSQKYVHRKCLQRWQSCIQVTGNPRHAHFCQVCQQKFTHPPGPPGGALGVNPSAMGCFAAVVSCGAVLLLHGSALALGACGALLAVYSALLVLCFGIRPLLVQDDDGRVRVFLTRFGAPVPGLYAGLVLVHQGPHLGIFGGSVILLVAHSTDGTRGYIVNKPIPAAEYLRHRGPAAFAEPGTAFRGVGGPVAPEEWTTLHIVPNVPGAVEACPGVYLGGSAEALASAPAGHVRVVRGAACWAPGQLDGELRARYWAFLEVAPGELFRADAAALWDDLQDRTPLPIL